MKIILQHTSGAFANVGDIPENQWRNGQEYHTVATARKGLKKALSEMQEICGPNAWDRHYRLLNAGALPIQLTYTYECYGSYHTHEHSPRCHISITLAQIWQPGDPEPRSPWATLLATHGWHTTTCPACHTLDVVHNNRARAEYERDQGWISA